MRKFARGLVAAASAVTLCLTPGLAAAGTAAQSGTDIKTPFEEFGTFLARVSGSQFQTQGVVRSAQAFGEMRSYVLNLYQGVEVKQSFFDSDSYFDCVVTETQPSVRALGGAKLATPPAPTEMAAAPTGGQAATQFGAGAVDVFGNAMTCSAGTIPMQRLTLERLAKFPTLTDFMAKKPADAGPSTAAVAHPHSYAEGYQYVNTAGGNSWLNVWNPAGEFSLSQQWYINTNAGQTVEGGWIHYPAKWNNPSVLFIFATPDNYASGCYNLDCAAFVQTNNSWTLGARFRDYSTYGGTQYGFAEQWKFYQGNWWLYLANTAIGYYPASVYKGGPMGTGNATLTEFGGETSNITGASWPQMGSALIANNFFGYAAFQNSIFNIDAAGTGHWSVLTPSLTHPNCYSLNVSNSATGNLWPGTTYLFYGGPGGPTGIC
jgi:neprosin-like protein